MKNISIWKDNLFKNYPILRDDKECDILIIGGGITGVSILYHLRNSEYKVILCEQNKIGHSVTGSSTGKLTYLQNDLIDKIKKTFDKNTAIKYINSQKEAINLALNIIKNDKIECDLVKTPSYIYTNKDSEVEKIIELEKFLNNCGIKTYKNNSILVESKYMFNVEDTYMFNPLKYTYGLIKEDDEIYEKTSIKKIEKVGASYICYTDKNKIKTKYVVIASHYPFFTLPFVFPIKGTLEKSYISASIYKSEPISLISYSNPFISIRNYKDYLIYLSNSHTISDNIDDYKNFSELKSKLKDKGLKPEYLWSNIDIITNDGLPYIGSIKDGMFIATGYNTWGMTNGILAGKIISDMLCGYENEYKDLFNPVRFNLSKSLGTLGDIGSSIIGYVNGFLYNDNNVLFKNINGEKTMTYKEYTVKRKCPHLGCDLVFNEIEKTWDCPCHGSRFDIKGKCISAPSNNNIKFDIRK